MNSTGIALLEVLCALVILAVAGGALLRVVSQAAVVLRQAAHAERLAAEQDHVMRALSLMQFSELQGWAGLRQIRGTLVRIDRDGANSVRIAVHASNDYVPPLETVLSFSTPRR